MTMWNDTPFSRRLGLSYPIVQGPFGGGLSSATLTATVSRAGGLGSFGAQGMTSSAITGAIADIRALTDAPFAINLWVSTEDEGAREVDVRRYQAALAALAPLFDELGAELPDAGPHSWPTLADQIGAILDARPPVFSFVFGVPPADVLRECRTRSIVTMGAATTVGEAMALADAGVDIVVASGFEAGGHRPSFKRAAEESLVGTFALVPQVADAVRVPVVAAGGIADGRGVAAALALGAHGVQIGTAFLACEESNAPAVHREAFHSGRAADTVLTRVFSGRLARGLRNRLSGEAAWATTLLPYPLQGQVIGALRAAALERGRDDLIAEWAGQSAPLVRHRTAERLFADLVEGATRSFVRVA
jgi:nitronate monooxygenase